MFHFIYYLHSLQFFVKYQNNIIDSNNIIIPIISKTFLPCDVFEFIVFPTPILPTNPSGAVIQALQKPSFIIYSYKKNDFVYSQ